jgi:hypothetical protein
VLGIAKITFRQFTSMRTVTSAEMSFTSALPVTVPSACCTAEKEIDSRFCPNWMRAEPLAE